MNIMIKKVATDIRNKILSQWKKNYPDYIIQFFLFVIFALALNSLLSNSLKPQTDINVSINVYKLYNVSADYKIDLVFDNKANFAGEDFYIYVWGMTSSSWDSSHATSEHCERIKKEELDYKNRVKIYCDFIPPNSKFGFGIDFELDEKSSNSEVIIIEYWGKTTPHESESHNISNVINSP